MGVMRGQTAPPRPGRRPGPQHGLLRQYASPLAALRGPREAFGPPPVGFRSFGWTIEEPTRSPRLRADPCVLLSKQTLNRRSHGELSSKANSNREEPCSRVTTGASARAVPRALPPESSWSRNEVFQHQDRKAWPVPASISVLWKVRSEIRANRLQCNSLT